MTLGSDSSTTDPALAITDAMIAVDHELTHLPPRTSLQFIEFCRRRLDASEARILADRYGNGATDRDVEDMAAGDDGKTSKAEAKRKARRAKAANANPRLADRMEDGTLSTEQADIIASAAAETDGEAACDDALIDNIAATNPEQGKKKAKDYVNERRHGADVQKRYDRQHRRRGVYVSKKSNGNSAITIHGPDEDIDEIERTIHTGSDVEYRADGGRDVPNHKHPRTHDQRNYDAARKLLTGVPEPESDASNAAETGTNERANKPGPRVRRATVFITATVDQVAGTDPSPWTTIDGKPLPASYIEEIAGDASFVAQVFSTDGELLWQGRRHRLATPVQIRGLIGRDKGCVQCGAHPDKCVAHHVLPWEAPRKGPTNINNLALLCGDCHTRLHAAKQTMFYDLKSQSWKVRPATPDELPPDGRPNRSKPPPDKYAKPHLWERPPQPGIRPKATNDSHTNVSTEYN